MRRLAALAPIVMFATSCSQPPKQPFSKLAEEFIYTTLENSPASATQAGYHRGGGKHLDMLLDDYSPAEIERQRRWVSEYRLRLMRSVEGQQLTPDERADYSIIQNQLSLTMLELTGIQNYRHNPTVYVELIGNALYVPYSLQYAENAERFRHIISRMNQIPRLLDQARRNLVSAPAIWTETALGENEGTRELIDKTLRSETPPELASEFEQAAAKALPALHSFDRFLRDELSRRTYDWRLGRDLYGQKFRYALGTRSTPAQALAEAERQMHDTRKRMYELALPLYKGANAGTQASEQEVIRSVLANIATRHSSRETYFNDAGRDLEEARAFVQGAGLLRLPPNANLQVIETPEFMRGIYSVGGFNPAPPLEPKLGAFYWLTPVPAEWPAPRVESKLREYNYYGLKLLTIHEAVPGHYVQFEYANTVEPPLRRLLRALYGNGPYIEGWAVFATEQMLEAGYLNHSPEILLTFLKQQLRVFANTVLDVRLQTMGMTDEEAIRLMMEDAFQEREEAEGKLRRAKLSSAQLPTYFVGWWDWHKLRNSQRQKLGGNFNLKTFNEAALKAGAVPLDQLEELLAR